jgi:hypothetical protein
VCQCGHDLPYALPKDRSCSEYEQACSNEEGNTDFLVCY